MNCNFTDSNLNFSYLSRDNELQRNACQRQDNVCFIKTRKTGSTTLSSILNTYGLHRNLSFALLKTNYHSGHLNTIRVTDKSPKIHFLPPLRVKPGDWTNYKYNMMTVHVRFNRTAFESFMQPGTKYITILRNPTSQYESAFAYYKLAKVVKKYNKYISENEALPEFLRIPKYYWKKTREIFGNDIAEYTRNAQISDLGLDHEHHTNITVVNNYISNLNEKLDFVLIMEYFDKSLVLLKNKLCWDWNDVVYLMKNARPPDKKNAKLTLELERQIKDWNYADYLLYQHYNRTFWELVDDYGPTFDNDLEILRMHLTEARTCVAKTPSRFIGGRWQKVYISSSNATSRCQLLTMNNNQLFSMIRHNQSSGYYFYNPEGMNPIISLYSCPARNHVAKFGEAEIST
ncbi:galactosylceramide sulfotransferase-like [Saccoglossus kowalevskii]